MLSFREFLEEKLIVFSGAKYGRIVFLAGGGASGKGYAVRKFLDSSEFKVMDVDELKKIFQKWNDLKQKYPDMMGLNLKKGEDVFKLHNFISDKGWDKEYRSLLIHGNMPETLPNIIFDCTLKDISKITKLLPTLFEQGYKSHNIHLCWVLTNYAVAVKNNRNRDRFVPEDILLQTHEGAATTMYKVIQGNIPKGLDGSITVILNNPEHTVSVKDEFGNDAKVGPSAVRSKEADKDYIKDMHVEDFLYVKLKSAGKPFVAKKELQRQVMQWIRQNVPKTDVTAKLMGI